MSRWPESPVRPRLTIAIISLCFAAACGKVGPPLAPLKITERSTALTAVQRGSTIVLSWPAPPLTAKESDRGYIAQVDIYRLDEKRSLAPVLEVDDYAAAAHVIKSLEHVEIQKEASETGKIEYLDKIDLTQGGLANVRLRYAVRYVNKHGQQASFSNTVAIEPLARIAEPPTHLDVTSQSQDVLVLSWDAPEANLDGEKPALVAGYDLYRRVAGRLGRDEKLNRDPIDGTSFTDTHFRYLQTYVYTVRALSQGTTGLIESADSPALKFSPVDTFPPAAPFPVSIASAGGVISLFWPASPESDVVGYKVYRLEEGTDTKAQGWILLTIEPITPVTFRDEKVTIGAKYSYRVTAVDKFKNESDPSSVVTETANP